MFRPTRLLLIHRRVHVYATIIIYTPFPFPPARRVDVQLYILFFHWIIYIYRSRFFRVEASRLFIEPRAHDCYLSINDKRNPIREARLTRIEKVGKKASFQKFSAFREAFDRSNICIRVVWYVIHALVLDEKTSNEYLFASGVCLPYWKV